MPSHNLLLRERRFQAVHSVPNAADFVGRDHDDARVKRRRPELLMFTSRLQILLYVSFFFYIGTLRVKCVDAVLASPFI